MEYPCFSSGQTPRATSPQRGCAGRFAPHLRRRRAGIPRPRGRLRPSGGKGGGIVTASAELAAARIMAVWLPRLAIDRWRRLQGCAKGEGADASPLVLIAETAHGPRIEAANDAGLEAGARPGMRLADARTLC